MSPTERPLKTNTPYAPIALPIAPNTLDSAAKDEKMQHQAHRTKSGRPDDMLGDDVMNRPVPPPPEETGWQKELDELAEAFLVEEIIDPRNTRPLLCEFANLAAPLRQVGPSAFTMRP